MACYILLFSMDTYRERKIILIFIYKYVKKAHYLVAKDHAIYF